MKRFVLFLAIPLLLLVGCESGFTSFFVSDEDEKTLGAQFNNQLQDTLPILSDTAAVSKWVNTLGKTLAAQQDRTNFTANDFHFYVVNENVVNAFATPGGYIYIYKGLIDKAANTDEVAAVVAHEIGHVAAGHYKEQVAKLYGLNFLKSLLGAATDNPILLTSAQLGDFLTQMKMSRVNEYEADSLAVAYTSGSTLQTNPIAMADFLDTLTGMEALEPSKVAQMLSTHPYAGDRSLAVHDLIDVTQAYKTASQRTKTAKPTF